MTANLIKTRTGNSVRHEVERLLECVPAGLSADNMSRIGRMRLAAVEEALLALEREGEVARREIVFRGRWETAGAPGLGVWGSFTSGTLWRPPAQCYSVTSSPRVRMVQL